MNKLLLFAFVLLVTGCKEKFDSPVPTIATGYLVIEGVINNDGDTTNIMLSRTINLNDSSRRHETGAIVSLEGSDGSSFRLFENFEGNYTINNVHLNNSLTYRLAIIAGNGDQYQSDFVPVRNNPPIDSLNWVREDDGVKVFVNTHDPQNNTRYYQWEFNETWEFHTLYSSLKYKNSSDPYSIEAVHRDASDPQIYMCWKFNASSEIVLGSSAKLTEDIIHLPVTLIPNVSQKVSVLYSIAVKQYSWSKEGYEFLERMKKNTESVGSIFDAQPSELNTNFHCTTNPSQTVIGFFNICTIREKRIFIDNKDLPGWGYKIPCQTIAVVNIPDSIRNSGAFYMLPTVSKKEIFRVDEFYASDNSCVDCRLTGTNVKPDYWP